MNLPTVNQTLEVNLVDVPGRRVFPARVTVGNGRILSVQEAEHEFATFLLPGFVDAHVHIESSMLVPREFARAATLHGTVGSVSDPHEIANVLGIAGVEFMLDDARDVPFHFCFGAPSCVPATGFETAGATVDAEQVAALLDDDRIGYLSEMMNFPGVLQGDAEVLKKIRAARQRGKPVDGHAPGLRGDEARRYLEAGITTDHECFTRAEAEDKLHYGAKILIREGSAARNFEELYPLVDTAPDRCMFCSDDKHPDELLEGHINTLVRRAISHGQDLFNVLRVACVNPVEHYRLPIGLLREGDPADFIEVSDLDRFLILRTVIGGVVVAERGQRCIPSRPPRIVNHFNCSPRQPTDFACQVPPNARLLNVIETVDGQLVTTRRQEPPLIRDGQAVSDTDRDILKLTVVNRYHDAEPAIAFVRNFGLTRGAIASSVAHDSHNVIAVGTSDDDLCRAVNAVIDARGGLSAVCGPEVSVLPLPVAGLMSNDSCNAVAAAYAGLDSLAHSFGSKLRAPYMTLSFMALLVIPELKLSDRGLFDGNRFEFAPLFA
ncbi:adenine deaminase [bacterium]|nr:adenine deaminase [bacterium]